MNHPQSAGARFWDALEEETPLQVAGTVNAYCALLAEQAGFRALYLSGAGVANASHGIADLGVTSLNDVLEEVRRITSVTKLPLLVDVDTGWGSALTIDRTVREMIRAGAAGVHLEDQIQEKRCGHRPGKQLVEELEMVDRLKAAVNARSDPRFIIMARTDSYAIEGLGSAIERATKYSDAGADMIFAEALESLDQFHRFTSAVSVPVLSNLTEFGKTPICTLDELKDAGVKIALYPLSAFRAMSAAAKTVYESIRKEGDQSAVLDMMQTRDELYKVLNYQTEERKLDMAVAEARIQK
ncbi:MAG: 2-methylisocitrate lyase [Candidatus Moanabacter tarae]|uniref:2-methylisocitrate lyase n=1 Tax=Candidatus Moanibacter tarae TaxID=2200854 RepID=A0A2Z4AE35_9BACT|nr:MAG: 2-methylisocitrate lyase [Candidatus Moanabacter tarae]|tara:strand:+ start:23995 stop:24888 length:894 start_codon:yes stop_codon:yes gene_type:complete